MDEHIEYYDELFNVSEGMDCVEEAFGVDEATAKASLVAWAKEVVGRYED